MQRSPLEKPPMIIAVLVLQFVPFVLFPAKSFSPNTQEWWLPILLAVMVIVADVQIIIRRSSAASPWALLSFAQGFNIISRLMMLWPNASFVSGEATLVNWPYLILTFLAMGLSIFVLWYTEKPGVRIGLLRA